MRILVTGAAGFIGGHLAARLLSDGHDVDGLDNFSDYYDVRLKQDRIASLSGLPRFRFAQADICDREALAARFAACRPECVAHLAAQPGVRHSLVAPHAYQRNNVEGFLNVLELCRHADPRPLLLYASSSSVYWGGGDPPFREDAPACRPINLYAATKRANELMAHAYARLFNLSTIGLRFFTVYGPWNRPDMAIYRFASAMSSGRPLQVFNQGRMRRDFTYVEDVVEAIIRCVGAADRFEPDAILNIGGCRTEAILDVIRILGDELGVEPELELLPMQAGDATTTCADAGRLLELTGYAPTTALREGLARFAAWFRACGGRYETSA